VTPWVMWEGEGEGTGSGVEWDGRWVVDQEGSNTCIAKVVPRVMKPKIYSPEFYILNSLEKIGVSLNGGKLR